MTSITFEISKPLGDGVWVTNLEPEVALLLTANIELRAKRTVIGMRDFEVDSSDAKITVPLQAITALVNGHDRESLLIDLNTSDSVQGINTHLDIQSASKSKIGDDSLIQLIELELSGALVENAIELVRHIRDLDPSGRFEESKTKRKFVNRRNNFVTIKVQPRVQNICITVYGDTIHYSNLVDCTEESSIEFKKDQHGYTQFNWKDSEALGVVKETVSKAKHLKETRANRY